MGKPKIQSLEALATWAADLKQKGRIVVHCHGVFDLLHIGHIKHLESARGLGDALVVTVTPDRFVNKGPHRPAFPERLRAEALASLTCVDAVAINEWPTAVETIELIKPDLFVKGVVRTEGKRDHTDAISLEQQAVEAVGGRLVLTDEETYSASALINRHLDVFTPEAREFLHTFRDAYKPADVIGYLQSIQDLKVLVLGEAIIDEYQFCEVMGKANKDPILAARHLYTERYAGGSLAMANHVANFCGEVGLLTMLGGIDTEEEFIRASLRPNIHTHFIYKSDSPTIVKRRFLEEYISTKLFEVYIMQNEELNEESEAAFCSALGALLPSYDVVVVADYGHGLFTEKVVELLCREARFLAVNTQANAGNRGFNTISKYSRADYVALGEPEMRLEARSRNARLEDLMVATASRMACSRFVVTRGNSGVLHYDSTTGVTSIPAFSIKLVDRIGAGDAVFVLTAPCAHLQVPAEVFGFISNVIGAEACSTMGNKDSIEPAGLFRHITSLMG